MAEYRVDDLQYKGLKVCQDPRGFCFGTDAVLLAAFAAVRRGDRIADLGTGCGVIPILLSGRTEFAKCYAVEIRPEAAEMARAGVELNGLQERIQVVCEDFRTWRCPEILDAVICNPPYQRVGGAIQSAREDFAIAKHEQTCTLEEVLAVSARLLKHGGRLALVHQSTRAADLFCRMRQAGIEPKRVRAVQARADREPKLVLVEGIRGARPYLRWEPTLILQEPDGRETREMQKIYHRGEWAE